MLALVGLRESSKSVWAYSDSGGASPSWSADTGANTYMCAVDTSGNVYVVGVASGGKNVWKFNSSGTLTASYNAGGGGDTYCVAVDSTGRVVVGYDDNSGKCFTRIDADFGADTEFGVNAGSGYEGRRAAIDGSDNITILSLRTSDSKSVYREKYNSSLVAQWTPGTTSAAAAIAKASMCLKLLADGSPIYGWQYSTVFIYYHASASTGASDENAFETSGDWFGMGIDSSDFIWCSSTKAGEGLHKKQYVNGDDINDIADYVGSDTYSNIQEFNSILYAFTYDPTP